MSSIWSYLESFLPSLKKSRISEDIRLTRAEIVEHTEPAYKTAESLLGKWDFKSELVSKQVGIFNRMVKNGNPIVVAVNSFATILKNLDTAEDILEKTFDEEIAPKGLTYAKTNVLAYIENVSFVSKFLRKWLNYIYICETAQYEDGNSTLAESLTPIEIEWIEANFITFCTAFNTVTGNPSKIEKQFSNIPDIIVTPENAHTLKATIGEVKLDPFQINLLPPVWNPIYHIGLFVAEWQADRYKAAKEEVKLLQLRKLNLEKLSEGKADAHIQKEIEYMTSRIQDLNYKIAKMEKENGI